jgi:ferredoxin
MRTDLLEREIDGVLVRIDRLLCVGFESCAVIAPTVFQLDADGLAVFSTAPSCGRDRILEACRSCPVDALTALDQNGRQLVP